MTLKVGLSLQDNELQNHAACVESAEEASLDKSQRSVTSKDGTTIAYEQSGRGPLLIMIASALADRSDTTRLAARLSEHFTVINYDRRGRGASSDAPFYKPAAEVEDVEALIDAAGQRARLFGSSSGAVLALDAAARLGARIGKLALYEPPFITDGSRAPVSAEQAAEIERLIAARRPADAVRFFYSKLMGIPRIGVFFMRLMPGWSKGVRMARTLLYDLALLEGTQRGKPLPAERWSRVTASTLVMTGEKSESFFHTGARALADLLPNAEHRVLKGQHHGSAVMAPRAFADVIIDFLKA